MAITKARKDELVALYAQMIEESKAIFLTEYGGMSVKELETLRARLRDADGQFFVTKNTLLRIALEQTDTPVPTDLLQGPVAAGFALGEAPTLAKALVDYAKQDEKLDLKGGIMEGRFLTHDQVEALAKLPSLDELRAQLLGVLSAPAQNIASAVANGVRQVVNVIDAYAKSGEQEAEAA